MRSQILMRIQQSQRFTSLTQTTRFNFSSNKSDDFNDEINKTLAGEGQQSTFDDIKRRQQKRSAAINGGSSSGRGSRDH